MGELSIKEIKELFGSMPIGNLPPAQLMAQNKRNKKIMVATIVVCSILGGIAVYNVIKKYEKGAKELREAERKTTKGDKMLK